MKNRNRRGYTLVFFVLFLVMCFALATLVIDIGLVHLTRRQLQTAANTAAKEALYDVDGDGRVNAQRFVRAIFDDDFDPTTADALSLGAGPDVPYYDGEQVSGDFRASAKYYLPDDPYDPVPTDRSPVGVYKPDIALNAGNVAEGDIVRGEYREIAGIEEHPDKNHEEKSDYTRDDFRPDPFENAVLVRMRRTGEPSVTGVRTTSANHFRTRIAFGWFTRVLEQT